MRTDAGAQFFIKNFCAAAGHHDQARLLQALQHGAGAYALQSGKMLNFHRSEGLDRQMGVCGAYAAQQLFKPGQGQVGVTAAHDVQLRPGAGGGLGRTQAGQDVFVAQDKRAGVVRVVAPEGAEHAAVDADVGIVDLAVNDIKGRCRDGGNGRAGPSAPTAVRSGQRNRASPSSGSRRRPSSTLSIDGRKAEVSVICCV